jgi:hypothetical protein
MPRLPSLLRRAHSHPVSGSLAIGYCSRTESPRKIVIGAYNDPRPDLAFMIGNEQSGNWGYDSDGNYRELGRSNLFAITTEGKGIFRHASFSEPTPQNPNAPDNSGGHKNTLTIQQYSPTGCIVMPKMSLTFFNYLLYDKWVELGELNQNKGE